MCLKNAGNRTAARLHIQEQILALNQSFNELSPISQIPDEILLLVFQCIQFSKSYYDYSPIGGRCVDTFGRKRWKEIRDISHVCRQWRLVTLDNPILWSRIDNSDPVMAVEEMLSRSKSSPLSVTIGEREFKGISESLVPKLLDVNRLQSLYLFLSGYHLYRILNALRTSRDCASHLQSIFIYESYGPSYKGHGPIMSANAISIPTPQLQHIELGCSGVSWNSGFQCTSLVSLTLQGVKPKPTREQFYTLLGCNPNLETLYVEHSLPELPSGTVVSLNKLNLPRLSSCTIKGASISEYPDFQTHVSYPASTAHLRFDPSEIKANAPCVEPFLSSLGELLNDPRSSCLFLHLPFKIIISRLPSVLQPIRIDYSDCFPHPDDISSAMIDLRETDDGGWESHWLELISVPGLKNLTIFGESDTSDADEYLDFFKRHSSITDLIIDVIDPQRILTTLLTGGQDLDSHTPPSRPCLPKLVNLTMQHFGHHYARVETGYTKGFTKLCRYLSQRRKCDLQIQRLELIDCSRMNRAAVKILEGEVGQVVWDGEVSVEESDVDESLKCDSGSLDDNSSDGGDSNEND